jgi:hypothetical protein
MKKKLRVFLIIEACFCLAAAFALSALGEAQGYTDTAAYIFSFPFYQIALGLRALSLSGSLGNAAALALYVCLCLLPVGFMLYRRRKAMSVPADWLLPLGSFLLFYGLYTMINPGGTLSVLDWPQDSLKGDLFIAALLGGVIYSVAAAYVILSALRRFSLSGTERLTKYLKLLMAVVCALLVFNLAYTLPTELIAALRSAGPQDISVLDYYSLMSTYVREPFSVFTILQCLVNYLPAFLEILVLFAALDLVGALETDAYSDVSVAAAGRMSDLCGRVVAVIMLSNVILNVLQLSAAKSLASIKFGLSLPLDSIILVLAAMLLAKYFQRGKELKDDADMII